MLCAGTTPLFSFKHSLLNDIVIELKHTLTGGSKSAGNIYLNNNGTSETLCNETIEITENVKHISEHVPKHLKPMNDDHFGHYLAGLIEGDGHFSSKQQLVIAFHSLDTSLAYYIKKRIGYGSIKKVRDKNALILVVSATKGLVTVINLINGKLKTENKQNQIIKNILKHGNYIDLLTDFNLNLNKNFNNHWLAGFSDADASFQIKLLKRNSRVEVRLNFQIDQKKDDVLLLIKNLLGGNIGYRKSQDTYYYGSTSFGSAKNVINYFDYYHLLSSKHLNYLK